LQAVRDLMDRGLLPFLLGTQPVNKRRTSPRWAVEGLAAHRGTSIARNERHRAATSATASNDLNAEIGRLRAENSDLRVAWAAMRSANQLLAEAEADREAVLGHLREAERRQGAAATKATKASRQHEDALAAYVMPADARDA
jgi:hypothetical protein